MTGLFCARCGGTGKVRMPGAYGATREEPCPDCQPLSDPVKKTMGGFRRMETSRRAALDHYPRSGTARWKVLMKFKDAWPDGYTHEQLWEELGKPPTSTHRSRCAELVDGGWVVDSGLKRKTASGSASVVWQLSWAAAKHFKLVDDPAPSLPYKER